MSAPLAVVATLSAVTMGVLAAAPASPDDSLLAASGTSSATTDQADNAAAGSSAAGATALSRRSGTPVSRSQIRHAARAEAAAREDMSVDRKARRLAKRLDDTMWTTAPLNLWEGPSDKADKLGLVAALKRVSITGRQQLGRAQIVVDGQSRWVTADYLSQKKPKPEKVVEAKRAASGPSLGGSCANGSSIEAGRASLHEIHEVVCANWPSITSYGTWRGDGEHGQGRAIDIMVSGATGWAIADFLRANYGALGIEYIIYAQKIWSVERSGEGWRAMSDRGSVTANHYDHVHVTVY
ncbi:SH3 domain-containing protein [Nocardioides sp. zg-1228]|uniref:SH3 domain-containing protein n=1 Tax=Nocardioides sp. zg-1228 TaxID=2763008 RepID=UPI001642A64D|nr:SH3 domain-containing protein [Nocardioides sp. zg-1228]MBC2934206.1 SH3 domain-containing protein [Nocardioides sp. zg-1228]QSF58950.1 SH3 domain-containing protein [Nocardioides sp. zg-1228]